MNTISIDFSVLLILSSHNCFYSKKKPEMNSDWLFGNVKKFFTFF